MPPRDGYMNYFLLYGIVVGLWNWNISFLSRFTRFDHTLIHKFVKHVMLTVKSNQNPLCHWCRNHNYFIFISVCVAAK